MLQRLLSRDLVDLLEHCQFYNVPPALSADQAIYQLSSPLYGEFRSTVINIFGDHCCAITIGNCMMEQVLQDYENTPEDTTYLARDEVRYIFLAKSELFFKPHDQGPSVRCQ